MQNILSDCTKMKFKHKNCSILIDDGTGTVYRDDRLMYKGDANIAIKTM